MHTPVKYYLATMPNTLGSSSEAAIIASSENEDTESDCSTTIIENAASVPSSELHSS